MKKKIYLAITSALVLGVTGCSNFGTPDENGYLLTKDVISGKTFAVTHLNDEFLSKNEYANIQFSAGSMVTGRSFCNLYSSRYDVTYNNLLNLQDTKLSNKECDDYKIDLEKDFISILDGLSTIKRTDVGYIVENKNGSFQMIEYLSVPYKKDSKDDVKLEKTAEYEDDYKTE